MISLMRRNILDRIRLLLLGTGLGALGTVLAAGLVAVGNTLGIERTADDVVTHAREALNTAATNQYLSLIHI